MGAKGMKKLRQCAKGGPKLQVWDDNRALREAEIQELSRD